MEEPAGGGAGCDSDARRRLVESSLWKEDVLASGHSSVWGSWYDRGTQRWGYACCRSMDKSSSCSRGTAAAQKPAGGGSGDEDDSAADSDATDSEEEQRLSAGGPIDWSGAPVDLLPREAVEDTEGAKPGAFVAHFVRFAVGAWRRLLAGAAAVAEARGLEEEGLDGFRSEQALQEAETAMEPLMRQLEGGDANPTVVQQLGKMVSLAADREYAEAGKAYMDMVLGHKKWNNTLASYGGAGGTNKGARIYITKQDDLVEYDKDPVVQKYMQCLRKLVHLVQCLRPNSDRAKHLCI